MDLVGVDKAQSCLVFVCKESICMLAGVRKKYEQRVVCMRVAGAILNPECWTFCGERSRRHALLSPKVLSVGKIAACEETKRNLDGAPHYIRPGEVKYRF